MSLKDESKTYVGPKLNSKAQALCLGAAVAC